MTRDIGFHKPSSNLPKYQYSCYNNMLTPLHMLLLIAGATDITRELLAAMFLEEHPGWKHLALEDIYADDNESEAIDEFQMSFNTIIACACASVPMSNGTGRASIMKSMGRGVPSNRSGGF